LEDSFSLKSHLIRTSFRPFVLRAARFGLLNSFRLHLHLRRKGDFRFEPFHPLTSVTLELISKSNPPPASTPLGMIFLFLPLHLPLRLPPSLSPSLPPHTLSPHLLITLPNTYTLPSRGAALVGTWRYYCADGCVDLTSPPTSFRSIAATEVSHRRLRAQAPSVVAFWRWTVTA